MKEGKQDLQKPIISDHVCISLYWGQICPWNNITGNTEKSPYWNHHKRKLSSSGSSLHQFPSMDGSIEGDINELSYSPIVVTVYFVWVRATLYIHEFIHSFANLDHFFPFQLFLFSRNKVLKDNFNESFVLVLLSLWIWKCSFSFDFNLNSHVWETTLLQGSVFILIVLILCTIGLYPLAAGVRWESVCSFVMFLTFRKVTWLHSLFRCFACCKKKQVTRIQMDIEPYFTELNSLAKYGFNQLFLLIWRRRDAVYWVTLWRTHGKYLCYSCVSL